MTSLFAQFQTSAQVEKDGVVLEYGISQNGNPIALRVSRSGGANTAFIKRLELALKPYRRLIDQGVMDQDQLRSILRRVYAETVVRGWENVFGPDGVELQFNVENCVTLFELLPDLFDDVVAQSQRIALFRSDILQLEAGN